MQQFGHYDPSLVVKLLSIYSTALYGSCLWQLNCDEHHKLNKAWNTAVKMIWDLPFAAHTRFLEYLSPVPHLESVLTGRYVGFVNNLDKSAKPLLGLLFSSCSTDLGSKTGQNIEYLLKKNRKQSLHHLILDRYTLKKAKIYPISEEEHWKLTIIKELSLIQKGHLETEFDDKYLIEILDYVSTS